MYNAIMLYDLICFKTVNSNACLLNMTYFTLEVNS